MESQRISTGSAALDRIMGGGIPRRSMVVVAGEPGSGKTVLALQALFHLVRHGGKGLYVTTLSEPALKLVRHTQGFAFFDEALVGAGLSFVDAGSVLTEQGPAAAVARILDRVESEEPDLVVVDSFKAVQDLTADAREARALAYDLAIGLPAWGATTLLLGEYSEAEIGERPEFAVADGILWLGTRRQELTSVRELEVRKLRGTGFVPGRHFFGIGTAGVGVFPRVRAPEEAAEGWSAADRLTTGVPGLDDLLGGGFPQGSATLVEGSTGTGKTLLGLHFLVEGTRVGEPGVLFGLEETPDQLRAIAAGFGMDLPALEEAGLLRIDYASPVELSSDLFLDHARSVVAEHGARRVVLDSLTSMAMGVSSERRLQELIYATAKHFRAAGATLLATAEAPDLLGANRPAALGARTTADNLLLLRYVELGGGLVRALTVLKARGVAHDAGLRRAAVGPNGFRVEGPFGDLRGILMGVPGAG